VARYTIAFADLYRAAVAANDSGERVPKSWAIAFDTAHDGRSDLLGPIISTFDTPLCACSCFRRRIFSRRSGGTDHGRGSCNFILGNDVNGGIVHGTVNPLAVENLEDGRDLAVTTDFRSVFSEVAGKHLKITNDKVLFPDWTGNKLGVMRTI
jgi:uncharacterized protein (DUF1501 family)